MKFAPIPIDEEKRLQDLKKYFVLDTPEEEAFDEITKLAALTCGAKISLVSLIDQDRQWFKSRFGLEATETPRDISFCGHAIMADDIFIVEDAELDARFCDNPLFLKEPNVRFYAGVPLKTPSGSRIGTLCVINPEKLLLSDVQKETLKSLSKHVIHLLELKIKNEELRVLVSKDSVLFNQAADAVMTLSPPNWALRSANPAMLKLFGASSSEEFRSLNPFLFSPEFQPDGSHSKVKANKMIELAIEKGSHFFEWLHFKLDGTLMECTVQLSKITEASGFYLHSTVRDVSKEKELKKQLTEAQSISKIGSWSYNPKSHYQRWSVELYKIFEIDFPQSQEKLYQLYRERIHPEDIEMLDRYVERAISFGEDYVIDHRIILDNGTRIKFVQGIGRVTRDAVGNVSYLTGTCQDRTAEVEAELKTKKIFESMGEGVVIQDSNGKIIQYNSAALSILEMDHDQLIGKSSLDPSWKAIKENGDPFPGEDHPSMVTLKTGKPVSNVIMGLRFGVDKLKWIRINSIPFQEGASSSVLATFSDITELVATKEENRFVLENVLLGIWKYNPLTKEVYWDNSMYKLYEIEPENFSGHYEAWLSSLTDNSKVIVAEEIAKALSGEKDFDLTFEIKTKSKTRFIGARAKVTRNQNGEPSMMYGINWDRTNEIELERKLELERAKSIHNARLATIGELAAGVGHEINNPLAIISGHINISMDLISNSNPNLKELQERFNKINTAVNRISEIVKSLRTFARSDDTQLTHFDLYALTDETVQSLQEIFLKEKVLLTMSGDKKTTLTEGNRGRIQQVLVNIIMNGKDASVGKSDRKVHVEISYALNEVVVVVSDNGSGISDDLKEKIFNPFFTTKDVNRGTGIGLSLVSSIIKEHHGKLDFVTKIEEGTSFKISLPVIADRRFQPQAIAEAPNMVLPSFINCNILIVDDEQEILEIFHSFLSKECKNVVTAKSAQDGYEIIKKGDIDLVISDVRMPGIDGFEFFKLITENKDILHPKVMFITGGVQMTEAELKILNELSDGFFTKPVLATDVLKKIKQLFPN